MTKPTWMLVVVALGPGACMAPVVEAEYEAYEPEERIAELGLLSIPDGEAPPIAAPAPAPVAADAPKLELLPRTRGSDACEHEVVATGFPAVRDDAGAVAVVDRDDGGNADFVGELAIELRDRDESVVSRSLVLDGEAIGEATDGQWGGACRRARAQIEQRIAAINAELAVGWRAMERLPLQGHRHQGGGPELPSLEEMPDASRRPVEALYHGSSFIVRVRGIEVLQSTKMPSWRGGEPGETLDSTEPAIVGLAYDETTGVALAELSYESPSCMSDTRIYTRAIELSPRVVEVARARAGFRVAEPSDELADEPSDELAE